MIETALLYLMIENLLFQQVQDLSNALESQKVKGSTAVLLREYYSTLTEKLAKSCCAYKVDKSYY